MHSYLMNLLFDPTMRKMHTVAFASGTGTNFREAVYASKDANFSVDLLLTDKTTSKGERIGALKYADEFDIPYSTVGGYQRCGSWQQAKQTLEGMKEYERRALAFNAEMLSEIQQFERETGIIFDFAVLAGYMRLFKGPLLRRFLNRAVNVHPADLAIFNPDGTRKYIGENAVYDALAAGEERTRSSIILLDPETDAGAVLVSGPWVEYRGGPVTQDKADKHQKKQKAASDWPSMRFALKSISRGEFGLHREKFHSDGNPVVVYRGIEMPYEGYTAPSAPA